MVIESHVQPVLTSIYIYILNLLNNSIYISGRFFLAEDLLSKVRLYSFLKRWTLVPARGKIVAVYTSQAGKHTGRYVRLADAT